MSDGTSTASVTGEQGLWCAMWSYLAFCLVWFMLILGPVVRSPLGSAGDLSVLAAALIFAWEFMHAPRLDRSLVLFAVLALLLVALGLASASFVDRSFTGGSIQVILRPMKALVVLCGSFSAITLLSIRNARTLGPRRAYEQLVATMYILLVVQAIIIILQFIYPAFRDLTYAVLRDSGVLEVNKAIRMPGFAGAGGAQLSAVQGLGFLLGVHLAMVRRTYLPYLVGNGLLIASLILTGRTGFVCVGVGLAHLFVSLVLRRSGGDAVRQDRHRSVRIAVYSVGTIAALLVLPPIISEFANDRFLQLAVQRSFETYLTYQETGEVSDVTVKALGKMYALPSNPVTLAIGSAVLYDNRSGRYFSDIGYVRQVWGYGLIGLVLYLAFYAWMGALILQRRVRTAMGALNVALGLWVLLIVLMVNYKEPFFFVRMSFPLTAAIVMGLYWLTPKVGTVPASVVVEAAFDRGQA